MCCPTYPQASKSVIKRKIPKKKKKDTEYLAEKKTLFNVIHDNQEFHQKYTFHSFIKLQGKNNSTGLVLLGSTVRVPWQSREDYDSSLPAKHNLMD